MDPIAVTLEEACEMTRIGRDNMLALMDDKRFPVIRFGKKYVIPVKPLEKFIDLLGSERHGYYK